MDFADEQPTAERVQTDESLRVEREKADDALGEQLAAIEEIADAVITKARERADELLATARAKTDRQASSADAHAAETVRKARAKEDDALGAERADADELVREERAERVALLSTERDETDRDLSVERERSDRAVATRDDFLGMVSHDLRDMLGVMIGFADLIARAEALDDHGEQVLTYVQRIRRSGARMNRLIGDLVDLASIDAGRLAVTRERGDPALVVREAAELFLTQASVTGVTLSVEVAGASTQETFDPARILQVLTNLLSNALKFTRHGGKVVVRLERAANELRFSVSDTGSGIPADHLETIFERFRKVTPADRRGVGLGLYISRCIVEGHGGRIWAESTVGGGSTFRFTLPTEGALLPRRSEASTPAPPAQGERR